MDESLSSGGLTKNPRPSNLGNKKVGLGTSKVLEDPKTCKLITPTLDGSNFSDSKMIALLTLRTTRFLMLLEEEMLKETMSKYGRRMAQRLRNGLFCMKIRLKEQREEERTHSSVLISTDHSTFSQDCQ